MANGWGLITSWWSETAWPALVEGWMDFWGTIFRMAGDIWDDILGAISNGWEVITGIFQTVWDTIVSGVEAAVGLVVQWFFDLPVLIGKALIGLIALPFIFAGLVARIVFELVKLIPKIITWGLDVLDALGGMILDWLAKLGEFISGIIGWGIDVVAAGLAAAADFVGNILTEIGDLPENFFALLTDVIPKIIVWAANIFVEGISAGLRFLDGVAFWLLKLPGKILTWLLDVIPKVVEWGVDFIAAGVKVITDFITETLKELAKLAQKIIDDLLAMVPRIINAIKDAFLGIGKAIGGWVKSGWDLITFGSPKTHIEHDLEDMIERVNKHRHTILKQARMIREINFQPNFFGADANSDFNGFVSSTSQGFASFRRDQSIDFPVQQQTPTVHIDQINMIGGDAEELSEELDWIMRTQV
jgi:phage-related protein